MMSRSKEVNMRKHMMRPKSLGILVFLALDMIAAGALAASGGNADDIQARYQAESAACSQKPTAEDRTTCLREAAAARSEGLGGQTADTQDVYERNALARCNALPTGDQEMCRRRTRGEGVVSGSVSEGGVYREYREITMPDAVRIDPVIVPPTSTSGQ